MGRRRAGGGGRARAARAVRDAADPRPERRRHLRGPQHQHVQLQLRIVTGVCTNLYLSLLSPAALARVAGRVV